MNMDDSAVNSPLVLIVEFEARHGQQEALERELLALIEPTRKEEGCLAYNLHRSGDAPAGAPPKFMLYEVWASREHHTRHTQTPHFQRWNARKDAVLASRTASFWTEIG
jgi:quinol monooxygenase YgiN